MDSEGNNKRDPKSEDNSKEMIKKLEKRIEELEKEKQKEKENKKYEEEDGEEDEEPNIMESVVGQFIPGLGGIVKTLEKSSPEFRERIAQTNVEIKHRLETGWSSGPEVERSISMRPIVSEKKNVRSETTINKHEKTEKKHEEIEVKAPDREPIVDVFEIDAYISVIAELPDIEEKDIDIRLVDNNLEISAGNYSKIISLPSVPGSIIEKTYKHGILQLKIKKEENDS